MVCPPLTTAEQPVSRNNPSRPSPLATATMAISGGSAVLAPASRIKSEFCWSMSSMEIRCSSPQGPSVSQNGFRIGGVDVKPDDAFVAGNHRGKDSMAAYRCRIASGSKPSP